MRLYSTKNTQKFVDFRHAVLKRLPEDNGLYMPEKIDRLPDYFFQNLETYSFRELSYLVAKNIIQGAIPN